MTIQLYHLCVCGHESMYHVDHTDVGLGLYCVGDANTDSCPCPDFRLDNLSYIEKEAEFRNLV